MKVKWLGVILVVLTVAAWGCKKNGAAGIIPPPSGPDTNVVEPPPVNDPKYYSQKPVIISLSKNTGGFYEALPYDYDTTSKKYPLLVFLHGGGEKGNGTTDLPIVITRALSKRLAEKTFPPTFTVKGEDLSFVIIQPQFKEWPANADVASVIKYSVDHYRVDPKRIYLSGMSMGGGATWEYAAFSGTQLAAIVPICGAAWADSIQTARIANANIPVWAFHNRDDSVVDGRSTTRYIDAIRKFGKETPVKMTLWETGGHDAWSLATDPNYKENDENMYEWMLQFTR